MEKDGLFGSFNWQCDHTPVPPEMEMNNNSNNCGGDQLQPSIFVNLNWDQSSTDQTANFESALSSLVSSPSSSNPNSNLPSFASSADSFVIRELIGRLGNICSSNNNNSSSCAGGGDEISPPNSHYKSNNTSCYSTPLNSPPKLNLDHPHFQFERPGGDQGVVPFAADPGFAERAARFSCFGRNYPQLGPSGVQEPGKLSRVSSSKSLKTPNPLHLQDGNGIGGQLENDMITMMMRRRSREELGNNAHQQSSASDQMAPSGSEGNIVRKRKTATASSNKGSSRGKEGAAVIPLKGGDEEHSNSKRCKSVIQAEAEANTADKDEVAIAKTPKVEQNSTEGESSAQKQGKEDREKESNVKPPEPPKQDYIHVRARRGQATDSHSLAERVRREKISERMKFLQDLVPGCNKVTGKAVMLDEIINYVQSLQRQVEFLSMKLATVNPRLDFNIDSVLSKDMHQPRGPMMLPQSSYQLEAESTTGFSYANEPHGQGQGPPLQSLITSNGLKTQCSVNINPLDASSLLGRSLNMQLPLLDGFTDAATSQLGALWEEDLQSVVQMGFGQNQQAIFSTHDFQVIAPEQPLLYIPRHGLVQEGRAQARDY